jgi:hypothetical protein
MGDLVRRTSDRLAARTTRRGFLGLAARATALIGGVFYGLNGMAREAAAYAVACCNLAFQTECTTCPWCPAGETHPYTWSCCWSAGDKCFWACGECYDSLCSCAYRQGSCGGNCPSAPAARPA